MSDWKSVRLLDGIKTPGDVGRFDIREFERSIHDDVNTGMCLDLDRIMSMLAGFQALIHAGQRLRERFSFMEMFGHGDALDAMCRNNTVGIAGQVLDQLLPHIREAAVEHSTTAGQWARVLPEFEALAGRPELLAQYDLGRLRLAASSTPAPTPVSPSASAVETEPAKEEDTANKPRSRWSRLDVE